MRYNNWFLRVVEGLDRVIADCVECGFTITLEFDAIVKGIDWNRIRTDLKTWILDASDLSHGSHRIILPTTTSVESQ